MALNGRKAQAARNDELILEAARAVFTADPGAPISTVAARAGVGISALYRRYRSKDDLLQKLCTDAIRTYADIAESAAASQEAPWEVFVSFMRAAVDARAGSLSIRLAGQFTIGEELLAQLPRAFESTRRVLDRAKAAGVLRDDIEVGDISLMLEQLQTIEVGDEARTSQLRHRYLQLILDGLHGSGGEIPGPAPTWKEIGSRYEQAAAPA
jgi:AcrR family transcriptional regulator